MLILTRRIDEAIWIGPEVRVIVLGIRGQQVKVGIEAPGDVNIWREELEGTEEFEARLHRQCEQP
jgi:carbon storage regulator